MAPLPPLSKAQLLSNLRRAKLGSTPWRFGSPHPSHCVLRVEGRFEVRLLELDPVKARAFMEQHGHFMPENASDLADPGALLCDAPTLDALIETLEKLPWPLPPPPKSPR